MFARIERPARRSSIRSLACAATAALVAGVIAAATPAPSAAEEPGNFSPSTTTDRGTLSDSPLLSADSVAERRCLVEASDIGKLITIHTGRWPLNTGYSADYEDIVQACQEGRYGDALDKKAVIWASLALHLPHRS